MLCGVGAQGRELSCVGHSGSTTGRAFADCVFELVRQSLPKSSGAGTGVETHTGVGKYFLRLRATQSGKLAHSQRAYRRDVSRYSSEERCRSGAFRGIWMNVWTCRSQKCTTRATTFGQTPRRPRRRLRRFRGHCQGQLRRLGRGRDARRDDFDDSEDISDDDFDVWTDAATIGETISTIPGTTSHCRARR